MQTPRALGTCSETFSPGRFPKPAPSREHSPPQRNPWVPGHLLCVRHAAGGWIADVRLTLRGAG